LLPSLFQRSLKVRPLPTYEAATKAKKGKKKDDALFLFVR
jgi:hypothetical protein